MLTCEVEQEIATSLAMGQTAALHNMGMYEAYNLVVHSDVALPWLPQGSGTVDITIRRGAISDSDFHMRHDGGRSITGAFPGVLRFMAFEGRELVYEPHSGISEEVYRVFLSGLPLNVLLRQRGLLVLHACCVANKGEAVAFAAACGWGKSTTADYFLRQGYHLLSDDVTAIDLSGDVPVVRPGFPQVKLRPQAAAWLESDPAALPLLHSQSDRRIRSEVAFCSTPQPLKRLYLLEPLDASRSEVVDLPPRRTMRELFQHTHASSGFTHPTYAKAQLLATADLMHRVQVKRLRRAYGLRALPEIFEVVQQDLVATVGHEAYEEEGQP